MHLKLPMWETISVQVASAAGINVAVCVCIFGAKNFKEFKELRNCCLKFESLQQTDFNKAAELIWLNVAEQKG